MCGVCGLHAFTWENCPKAMKGQYHNPKDGKLATISCEALVVRRLYCWHWFSGRCGTNNDITVLDNSPLFNDILSGKRRMTLPEGYVINGVTSTGLLYMLSMQTLQALQMQYTQIGPYWYCQITLLLTTVNST